MALQRILDNLKHGAYAALNNEEDRRMGPGQSTVNAIFRQYVADMVERYKVTTEDGSIVGPGDAERGIDHFVSDRDREKELVKMMEETWALVKDKPDAIKVYGKDDPGGGKEYNSEFKKCLSRKFYEAKPDVKAKKAADAAERKADKEAAQARRRSAASRGENLSPNIQDSAAED